MADDNEGISIERIASKRSVNLALDLLRTASSKSSKRKRNEKSEEADKIRPYCLSNLVERKESNAALGFSENHAILEMRSCLVRHDWKNLQELFPLLLGCYSDVEPIIWRHALIILLCSPDSDAYYLQEFLEMCIGAHTGEDSNLLRRLLTLRPKNS